MVALLLAVYFTGSIIYWTRKNGISPMPTSRRVSKTLVSALPDVNGTIVDLGSGWGTLLRVLAKRYPHSQIVGYETSTIPYLFSKLTTPKNVRVVKRDFFKEDLSFASLAVCYLYIGAMCRLRDCSVPLIAHTFAIPGKKADRIIKVEDLYSTNIYFYD